MLDSAIIIITCSDQAGIVAAVTGFIHDNNGNIIDLEQHVDIEQSQFYMRIEWDFSKFIIDKASINASFKDSIADSFNMNFNIYFSTDTPKLALFVSKHSHCFYDMLSRYQSGEWRVAIPVIISNHRDLEKPAKDLDIPYHYIPITKENKLSQEQKILDILKDNNINLIVLARYMQILSENFITQYKNKIINIHHSFLPAFPGAKPYHSAYERGVKIIGATSHYVTADLDAGPIIAQDIEHVSHTDSIKELIRKGSDIEKIVLARAIWKHINHKTLVYNNRTIIFT
ncbi:MAG: formyltetrahydrofolate deformylase [Gammaproteobacteria bacterium]